MTPELWMLASLAGILAVCFGFGFWCRHQNNKRRALMTPEERQAEDDEFLTEQNLW